MLKFQRTWIVAVCCAIIFVGCADNEEPEDIPEDIEVAELVDINNKLRENPKDHHLYFERAVIQANNGFFESALKDLDRAISLDSTVADYHFKAGEIAFMVKKSRLARDSFEKCVEIDPAHTRGLLKLAELYIYVEGYPKSIEYIDRALKVDKFNDKAYMLKGLCFKYMGDTTNAISSFQTAVEQNPNHYKAFMELGILHGALMNPLAIDYFNNALKIDPLSVEANYGKAYFFQASGEMEQAMAVYNNILNIQSDHVPTLYNLGYIYANAYSKYDIAITFFNDAIKGDSSYVKAYYMRGASNEKLGKKDEAIRDYTFVMKSDPSFVAAAVALKRISD